MTNCRLLNWVSTTIFSLSFFSLAIAQENTEMLNSFSTEVVVTGTRTENTLSEVPVRTEVIKRKQIEQTSSRNLADAVEFTTGVRVEDNCQSCNFSQIRLNGLPGSFTQILFDSQPTISSLAAVYGIEQIPSRLIERIEVVKGGASSIYGPGAIGGIINVIPYIPAKTGVKAEYRFEYMDGSTGDSSSGFNHGSNGSLDYVSDDRYSLGTLFFQTDLVEPLDLNRDGFTEVSNRELQSIGSRFIEHLPSQNAMIIFFYSHTNEYRRGGDNIVRPPTEVSLAEEITTIRDEISTTFNQTVSPSFDYRLTSGFSSVQRSSYYGANGNPNAFGDTENPLINLDSQFNYYGSLLGDHILSFGIQRRDEYVEDNLPGVNRFIDEHYFYTGVYLQDEYSPADKIDLVIGSRIDKHSEINSPVISPRLSIKYSPRNNLHLRSSVSTGFRAPQVFDEDLHLAIVGGEGTVIRNSADLDEEKSISYQSGVEWTPQLTDKTIGLFEANLFNTLISDSFFVDPTDNPDTMDQFEFTRINRGGAEVYGVELNHGYRYDNQFSVDAGFVFQRARYDNLDDDFKIRDFFRTPQNYGILSGSWQNNDMFDLFVGLKYTGRMFIQHYAGFIPEDKLEESPKFLTVDASISKKILLQLINREVVLTVGGRNITNEYQRDFDQGILRDAGYRYGPRFPRSFYTTLAVNF